MTAIYRMIWRSVLEGDTMDGMLATFFYFIGLHGVTISEGINEEPFFSGFPVALYWALFAGVNAASKFLTPIHRFVTSILIQFVKSCTLS